MKDIIEPLRLILMNASLRHILPPFAVLAAVIISAVSCGRSQHERSIAVADSLVEADQRAAVTYIDSIASPSRGGLPRSVRMKLALLRAKGPAARQGREQAYAAAQPRQPAHAV